MKKTRALRVTLPALALFAAIALTAFTPNSHHKTGRKFWTNYYYGQESGSSTAYVNEVITIGSQWHDVSNIVNDSYFNGDPVLFANTYCDYGFGPTCVVQGTQESGGQATVIAVYQGAWGL